MAVKRLALAGLLFLTGAADDGASGPVIHQRGRLFSPTEIELHRNQPITFLNDDTVPHNVMSLSEANGFDLGSQMPGIARTIRFDTTGIVTVICAIHPRMRMVVTIVE